MSGTDHSHPTFGVCECGHLDFMHPWVDARVEYQGKCMALFEGNDLKPCQCARFHADPIRVSP